MKRGIAALLLAALLSGFAWAEEAVPTAERATIDEAAAVESAMTDEEATAIVDALFVAAAGTTQEDEKRWASEQSEEEYAEHWLALAEYRALTLPWLAAAFVPEEADVDSEASAAPMATIAPEDEDFSEDPEEIWTVEDGFGALQTTQSGMEYLELLGGYGCVGAENCLEKTNEACRIWMDQIHADVLKETNADYACWLYCPQSPIDYPVVQGADNSQYLKRLFDGTRNACGTLFIDYRNLPAFQDPNTLIYGHHMRNGSMFKSITYYAEQSWYESHPFMLVISPSEIAVLEVLSGYLTDKNDHCYDVALSDDEDLLEFVETARGKSDFETMATAEAGDRLITLSTCAYAFQNARYILVARMETVWQNPDVVPELMAQYQAKRMNKEAN